MPRWLVGPTAQACQKGTLAVHAGEGETLAVPSVTTPVYQTTTYRFPDAAEAAAYLDRPEGRWLYSRLENPTVLAAEKILLKQLDHRASTDLASKYLAELEKERPELKLGS